MAIDPRTLQEIRKEANCHLVPECFGISNMTVRLDQDFDNRFGTTCDAELKKYFEVFFGDSLPGTIALGGGSKSLKAVASASGGYFVIPKPAGGTVREFADRALGLQDGKLAFESFTGHSVDCASALLSIVHSAMLVLYHQGVDDVFGPKFDQVRRFFEKAIDRALTQVDYEVIRGLVEIQMAFPRAKLKNNTIDVNGYRKVYDPSFDVGDGLIDAFPNGCVTIGGGHWIVRLPYSKSLRSTVKFER